MTSPTASESRDTRLPFTVLLDDTPGHPIEIEDQSVGLRMAIVEKSFVHLLGEDWDAPGAYILLDNRQSDGTYGVYAGKAPAGIRSRLKHHDQNRDWYRAVVIQRGTRHGMTSAHAGWLEGDLYQLFDAAEHAQLHNKIVPSDDTVPPYEVTILESFRDPIIRVLNMLGYGTESADPDAIALPPAAPSSPVIRKPTGSRPRTHFGIEFSELVDGGVLQPGEQLTSTNRTWPARATVTEKGEIEFDGQTYSAPSTAASAAKNGSSVNGWDFWAVERPQGSIRLSALRKQLLRDTNL